MEPALSIANLRKHYGATVAVDDVSLEIAPGEIFGIVGPNGSGKTTTVECAQGLRTPDRGTIRMLGLDPARDHGALRARVGSQLQESALPDRIRVWEALDLFASLSPSARGWAHLLDDWGLAGKRDATYASLSGGQRQRLLVALALVNRPELVFLDEMTTGLDPGARREAWRLVEAVRAQGVTVVLVTHFMDEAERLCDRIAVLRHGRVVATGSPADLVRAVDDVVRLTFTTGAADVSFLDDVPGVQAVSRTGTRVVVEGDGPLLALVASALVDRGIVPDDLRAEHRTLEDAYLQLMREGSS